MERIVTKIGDVTIERRVSKPQPSKSPLESVGSNLQQQTAVPRPNSSSKIEEARGFLQNPNKQELPGFSKNIPKPPNIKRMYQLGGNVDVNTGISSKKQEDYEFPTDIPVAEVKSQEAQKSESNFQHPYLNPRLETKNSGVSLPKAPKIDSLPKHLHLKGNDTQPSLVNGPDLSKLVGISIERRKRVDVESQFSKPIPEEPCASASNNDVVADTAKENIDVKPEINLDDEYDDSYDEEEFEGESAPLDGRNENDVLGDDEDEDDGGITGGIEHNSDPPNVPSEDNLKKEVSNENESAEQNMEEFKLEKTIKEEQIKEEMEESIKEEVEDSVEEEGCEKESDINDLVCTDLVELMQKGEIEGEIEEVKEVEEEAVESQEKKGKKRRAEKETDDDSKNEDGVSKKKKKKKKTEHKEGEADEGQEEEEDEEDSEENEDGKEKNIDKSKVTNANLRKNIREVMDETKLDEATLSAQRQEAERLKRLQEQQRIIREVQRQIALNRQNQKSQNKVLSLLQGNSQTSILKSSAVSTQSQGTQAKVQNSVLVKLSNGEQTNLNNRRMIELLKNSKNKVEIGKPTITKTLLKQGMVTPSVTIAPITKKEIPEDDKKKKKDVVTISSDSEDDCIVLSDEDESEPEEDPTNSGMHTNDKYNLPDEKGRVVVNVGHPESETDLYLAPQIARVIKPHQIGGIRFLYDNVIESIDRFPSSAGFGCILAHSMGLGKTLQIVSFSDIFLRYTPAKTILCIMPINTIQNWLAEFNMWLPKESSTEEIRCRDFDLFIVNESLKTLNARARVILDWHKSGGVLLMGYELFRLLSLKKLNKSKKKKKDIEEENAKNKELIEEVYSALVIPGPDLVICDEGHRIKNSHATTSQALKQIRTKRRIVLTGYPLQNNLMEYWCMVDFVRPNYLGSKTEFSNMFERPIQNGQCIDSTPQDKRLMRYRAHVLHSLLEGFVQRRSHAVLQSALPEKEEYVLLLRFTAFQRKLYDTFMNEVVRTVAVPNPLKAFAVCCKIWNHPDVLYNFLKKKGEEIDLDLEEALPPSLQTALNPYGQQSMGPDLMNQQGPLAGLTPWPKRGPGSRGGKGRQSTKGRVSRGRKPAATIPPNVSAEQEKNEPLNVSQFPGNSNFPNQQEGMDSFQGRNYTQTQFTFGNEYNSQSGSYPNPNYNKNPLNNLENMSSGNYHNKNFFSQQNINGNHDQYGNPRQNFDSGRLEPNFNPNISNDSNLNATFDSSLNSGDSNYNQNDFKPDFSSEFYSSNNFQSTGNSSNYSTENKPGFQGTAPYFQNPGFRNSENFRYQSSGNNLEGNFQNYEQTNPNFPGSRPESNFQSTRPESNFQSSRPESNFQSTRPESNFQSSRPESNFQSTRPESNFPSSRPESNFQSTRPESNFQSSRPESNFQSGGGVNFQNQNRTDGFQNSANNSRGVPNQSSDFLNSSENRFHNSSSSFQGSSANFEENRNDGFGRNSNFQENSGLLGENYQGQNRNTGFQEESSVGSFQGSNYERGYWGQSNWGYPETSKGSNEFQNTSGTNDFMPQKFDSFEEGGQEDKNEEKSCVSGNNSGAIYNKGSCDYSGFEKSENESKFSELEEAKVTKPKEDEEEKKDDVKSVDLQTKKEDASLPYDWAMDLFKSYVTGVIENSSKMEVFFHIVTESIKLGDRLLVFSQSLLTLDLIEDYLHRRHIPDREEIWAKNKNYFRLDGSTPGLEREKLINEFNANANIFLFLVSTRAGSLGINLVGANRVVVFDASWNPCHDTQAVCRVYRYGQRKPCFVYRLVMDSCLEKKIYDRQVNKQGMADRVVDELNPDAHLSIKEVTNLCWDDQEDTTVKDFSDLKDKYNDEIIKILLERCSKLLSKEPFQHESLLIDRKEKKLSQAEKRLAKRSYELEKQAANQPKNIYSFFPNPGQRNFVKPIASVRPMQSEMGSRMNPQFQARSKWIPAEVWQKQGMSAQEMTLPLDVVIPTSSPEKTSIVLKAGQRVMVLKSPKGIYMQLENGKIIAIRSAFKVGQNNQGSSGTVKSEDVKKDTTTSTTPSVKSNVGFSSKIPSQPIRPGNIRQQPFMKPFSKVPDKKMPVNMTMARSRQVMGKAKPFMLNRKLETVSPEMKQKLMSGKTGFGNQEENFTPAMQVASQEKPPPNEETQSKVEEIAPPTESITKTDEKPVEEKQEEKAKISDSLETLRKVTESIPDTPKREDFEGDTKYSQLNLKNYRHNFSSQVNSEAQKIPNLEEPEKKKEQKPEIQEGSKERSSTTQPQQQGNENVQNWLKNQSYPPMDPYGNYFPGYYYGPGPGPMMPPYDGFYPPTNYGHPIGRNSPMAPTKQPSTVESPKVNPLVSQQPAPNIQNPSAPRNPPGMNTPPMYPPYPNPYPYPYNYPANPGFNNQGFSFPNQNQSGQQLPTQNPTQTSGPPHSNQSYDSSVYSAFHRPDAPPFQSPENSYPSPYPRPPYPSSGTPGFFPYNSPYPNYPYGPNFNPYMHPAGYGYPMQNPHQVNSQTQNQSIENNAGNTNSNASS